MKRWWLPSISLALWLMFFLGLTLSDWRIVFISADGDPSLHRRIGEWMIENRQVVREEQFSHTRLGTPLVSKEWLGEVVFAVATKAAGWNGLVLLAAALIATTLWLLHRLLLAQGSDVLLATALTLAAAWGCMSHWLGRPHLLTHLLVVIMIWQLHHFESGRYSARRLWLTLPVLMLLWTNLHGAFFIGFILLGIYLLGAAWDRQRHRALTLAGIMAASLALSLVNPNGWNLHAQVLQFLRTPELSGMVNEFRSPNFHSGGSRGLVLVLALLAGTLMVVRPKLSATEILLLGVWGYFALHSVRNAPVFALVAIPVLARHLQPWANGWPEVYRRWNVRTTQWHRQAGGTATLVVVVGTMLWVGPRVETELFPERFPIAAVKFIKANPGKLPGEMFNDYGWGGYLLWALPERKVFIDGRNDFYGKELVDDFNEVDKLKPGWREVLEKHRVGWTILPRKHPLHSLLALDTGWQNVYEDGMAIIYARRRAPGL